MDDDDNIPLTFGKYAGRTPNEIARKDPGYIVWLYENVAGPLCSRDLHTACALAEAERDAGYPDWDIGGSYDDYSW